MISKGRLWLPILFVMIVMGFAVKTTVHYYADSLLVRLDPSHAKQFEDENRTLIDHRSHEQRIVLLGDSRIAQWENPPTLPDYEVVNRGIIGDTTAQVLLRLQRDVIALAPDVVAIQVGINDLKAIGVLPKKRAWIIDQVKNNITQIVAQLQQQGIAVHLMTILPAAEPNLLRRLVWSSATDQAVASINRFILTLASDAVVVVDSRSVFVLDGKMRPEFARDTLHINAQGYERLGTLLERSVKSIPKLESGVNT